MKEMRILQVFPSFRTGGVEEGALAISNALQQQSHRSFLVSSGGHKVADAEELGAQHFLLPLARKNLFALPFLIKRLKTIIQQNNIDVVHARSRWPAWISYYAAKQANIPFVTTFHGVHKIQNQMKKKYNAIMVKSPHVISISDYVTQHIKENYSTTLQQFKTQIHTIPRGIDIERFTPENVSKEEINKLQLDWHLNKETPVILLPARMTRLKGHSILIEALSHLKDLNWTAIFVGADVKRLAYQNELEGKIKQLGLKGRIKIVPAISNMPAAYSIADLVVFPTEQAEAFGRIVIEAQAMGVPLITANIGAQSSLVEDGKTGWLFENKNPQDLAEKIQTTLQLSKVQRDQYRENSRRQVIDNYTKDLMCQRTLDVYRKVIDENHKETRKQALV